MKLATLLIMMATEWSPPARGRGLKRIESLYIWNGLRVAPRAGAWIETFGALLEPIEEASRPPRGGVD